MHPCGRERGVTHMRGWSLAVLCCLGAITGLSATAAIRQGFVPGADGVRLHFYQAGPNVASHTLLFIPGWRISSEVWRRQLRYFSGLGDRVIAIDSRSQGGSSLVYAGNDPEDRARDIHRLIVNLHLTHLILVGWSQGVQDVAAYVQGFGTGALRKVVLVDSPVSDGPSDVTDNPAFVARVLKGIGVYSRDPRDYSAGMMRAIISRPGSASLIAALTEESLKTPPSVGISMLVQDLFTVDRRPILRKFDRPTLVIASGESPLLEQQRQMAAQLPMGRIIVIRHAAHAVFIDRPGAFERALETFITRRVTSRGAHS